MSREAMKLALEALEHMLEDAKQECLTVEYWNECVDAITALREALAEQPAQQEPVALKWQQAPVKTQWGDDMVVASVAIDNDHTLSLYCERDQTAKVDAMLAQRTWVGLSYEDIDIAFDDTQEGGGFDDFARAIEAKLKEKNT